MRSKTEKHFGDCNTDMDFRRSLDLFKGFVISQKYYKLLAL